MPEKPLPKAVIIRGDWLCKRDTQYYEPLMSHYNLLGVSVRRTQHDLSLISFPVICPWSPDSIIAALGPVQKILDRLIRLRSENFMYLFGLEKICAGAAIIDVAETFHPFCRQVVRIKQRTGIPILVRAHENIPFAHSNLAYRRETKRLIFEHADAFVTCSEMGRHTLELEGAPPDRIFVIPIGTNTQTFSPQNKSDELMAELEITPDNFVVLFPARIVWEKGITDVLNALALLRPSLPELRAVIVGDGPDSDKLDSWINSRGLRGVVKLTGRVPVTKMPDIYAIADVVLVPSIATRTWQEQFGAVLIEAMSCGKPVIGSDAGAIPEVLGDCGLIIPQANYMALASAIRRLHDDRALCDNLGTRARQKVLSKFSNEVVACNLTEVYNTLVTVVHSSQAKCVPC